MNPTDRLIIAAGIAFLLLLSLRAITRRRPTTRFPYNNPIKRL